MDQVTDALQEHMSASADSCCQLTAG